MGDGSLIILRTENKIVESTSPAREAIIALSKIGKPAIEPLRDALNDKDSDVRGVAEGALEEIKRR